MQPDEASLAAPLEGSTFFLSNSVKMNSRVMANRKSLTLRIEKVFTPDPGYSFEESVESSLKSGFTV